MRKQLFNAAASMVGLRKDNNSEDLYDILNGDEKPTEIMDKVETYLDKWYSNGFESRWNTIGNLLWGEAASLQDAMYKLAWSNI